VTQVPLSTKLSTLCASWSSGSSPPTAKPATSDGKTCPPIFIPTGLKVNTEAYIGLLERHLVPWLCQNYPDGNYLFQQDGAPAHTSKRTQEWLATSLSGFWSKDMWPPSSPDLNPLDYLVWGVLEAKACKTSHPSVEAQKVSNAKNWRSLSKAYVIKMCKSFRIRLEKVVKAEGGLFEKN